MDSSERCIHGFAHEKNAAHVSYECSSTARVQYGSRALEEPEEPVVYVSTPHNAQQR